MLPHSSLAFRTLRPSTLSSQVRSFATQPPPRYSALFRNLTSPAARKLRAPPVLYETKVGQHLSWSSRRNKSSDSHASKLLFENAETKAEPKTDADSQDQPAPPRQPYPDPPGTRAELGVPSYDMTFTCKPCKTRSTHRLSKQGYHQGTILITCPNCKNRHLISDNLKASSLASEDHSTADKKRQIFSDKNMTIDKFLEENGEVVHRGALGPDGNIELWDKATEEVGRQYVRAPAVKRITQDKAGPE